MVKKLGGASTKGWVESAIPPWLGLTVKSVCVCGGGFWQNNQQITQKWVHPDPAKSGLAI